ncbi:Serine phosphatase RsbU, regulator of sigma subunit protein [Minicystis rosea]|nr:Serine phosphatase RsbU, regulator of sigma subunit protein [Minicystis rosea]
MNFSTHNRREADRSASRRCDESSGVQVDVTDRARAEQARRILSEVTATLIESLDFDVTLRNLARIVVQHLADGCAIDEADERGELSRLVAETSGARSADEAARLLAFAPTATGNSLATRVLRSGKPLLVSEVPGDWDWIGTEPEADEHRSAFAKIGVQSLMVVPLIARGRPLGVLGIISTRPDRRYEARHLVLAEEISRRAALALDNARLHRQAEAALRARSEALAELDAFLNASPVGFLVFDRELRFRRVNAVYARWERMGPDEIVGRSFDEIVSPAFKAQIAPLLDKLLRKGEPVIDLLLVGELPSGSGKVKYHLDSFIPVLDVDGTSRAVGVVITDVTELKEAEEKLRQEAMFRERFIGVLAHELRAPLAVVAAAAGSLVQDGNAPATWMRTVVRIARAVDRMGRMIGNLLDLARCRGAAGSASRASPPISPMSSGK